MKMKLITPEGTSFEGEIDAVTLPGTLGTLTVLPGHARLINRLKKGRVIVRGGGKETYFEIGSGVAEVESDHVTLLVESSQLIH